MREISRDLTLLRKHLKLDVQDIHEATRFPMDRIEAFESGTLFEDSDFESNITYIRSFVRSYGKAINLPDDVLIDCLDLVELGSYNRQLIDYFEASQKKKGKKSPVKEQVILDDTVDPSESTSNKSISNTSTANKSTSGKPSKGELTDNDESVSRGKGALEDSSGDNTPANSTSASNASSPQPVSTPSFKKPPVDGVDWASKPIRGQTRTPIPPHVWVLGAVSTLLIMAIITLVWWFSQQDTNSGDSAPDNAPTSEPTEFNQGTASDTNATDAIPSSFSNNSQNGSGPSNPGTELAPSTTESPQPNAGPLAYLGASPLNATYSVLVYAANGRLEPIRVWSDQKPEIDPYWIEQGHAMRFEMDQEIRLSGQFSNLRLIVNGRDLGPISPNSAQNGIPTFTLNLSTPQMASLPREPQPLNLEQDLQIPTEFVDRPTFE
ncbi:MAG: helix-turn-helix domain-containing protein [Balneolaceae bacterium]|nr:helix-turn-helix domain-containing protein [Balneolaceae bacterium]